MLNTLNSTIRKTTLSLLTATICTIAIDASAKSNEQAQANDKSCDDGRVVTCGWSIPSTTASKPDHFQLCTEDKYEDACAEIIASNAPPNHKAMAYYIRGGLRLAEYKYVEAIDDFKAAYSFEPGLSGLSRELGQALEGAEQYAEAKKYYSRALAFDPSDVMALYGRGKSNAALADWDAALSDLTMVLNSDTLPPAEIERATRYKEITVSIVKGKSPKLWGVRDILTMHTDKLLSFYYDCDNIDECIVVSSECQNHGDFSTINFDIGHVTTEELASWAGTGALNSTVKFDSQSEQKLLVSQLTLNEMDGDWSYQVQILASEVQKMASSASVMSFSTGIEQSTDLPITKDFRSYVDACDKQ